MLCSSALTISFFQLRILTPSLKPPEAGERSNLDRRTNIQVVDEVIRFTFTPFFANANPIRVILYHHERVTHRQEYKLIVGKLIQILTFILN